MKMSFASLITSLMISLGTNSESSFSKLWLISMFAVIVDLFVLLIVFLFGRTKSSLSSKKTLSAIFLIILDFLVNLEKKKRVWNVYLTNDFESVLYLFHCPSYFCLFSFILILYTLLFYLYLKHLIFLRFSLILTKHLYMM